MKALARHRCTPIFRTHKTATARIADTRAVAGTTLIRGQKLTAMDSCAATAHRIAEGLSRCGPQCGQIAAMIIDAAGDGHRGRCPPGRPSAVPFDVNLRALGTQTINSTLSSRTCGKIEVFRY